jgi:hypothetical protein
MFQKEDPRSIRNPRALTDPSLVRQIWRCEEDPPLQGKQRLASLVYVNVRVIA